MIKIIFPFSEELLDGLFSEFDWVRQDAGVPHPVTTGNCSTGHPRPRGRDNGDSGEYQNAACYCRHCYPGNPARITWDRDTITVEADEGSSKAFRAILTHRRLLRPLVGGVMLTSIEDLRGLRLISFPNEDD